MGQVRDSLAPLLMGFGLLVLGLFHYLPLDRASQSPEQVAPTEMAEQRAEPDTRKHAAAPSVWNAVVLPPPPPTRSARVERAPAKRVEVEEAAVAPLAASAKPPRPALQPEAARFPKAKAEPLPRPALKPDSSREHVEEPIKSMTPKVAAEPVIEASLVHQVSAKDHASGVALMNDFMAEEGASIQLSSPDSTLDRDRLRQHLAHCYDRQLVINSDERFWRSEDPAGTPWRFDPRRYSPMLRYLDGLALSDEGRSIADIRRHHGLRNGQAVALVSLAFDRKLLGGLSSLIGAPVGKWGEVRGAFKLAGRNLLLERISVDGKAVSGRLNLGTIGRCN